MNKNNTACGWELVERGETPQYEHLLLPQIIQSHSPNASHHIYNNMPSSVWRRCYNNRAKAGCKKKLKTQHDHRPADNAYIHVRARRGQATDSHSLAERVRRHKISQRMKVLQTLVPGCHKVTGKVLMLDEIINYVQSLQNQVELTSVNPIPYDFGMDYPQSFHRTPASSEILNGNGMVSQSSEQAELAYNISFINPSPLFLDYGNSSLL